MANENMIKFLRGNVANLPQTATAGALYFTKDEGIYMGMEDGSYHRYGEFIVVADVDSLPASGAHDTCMYYCVKENILAKFDATKNSWTQINKQPDAETLKTLLGLSDLAYKSEVAEGDLNAALKEKVNAAAEGNHSHANKGVLDGITADKVSAWDAAEQNAKDHATNLNTAMNTRVEALEAIDHEHVNKALLDTYTQTEADLADAVAKKHEHANAAELAKIADGDKAKWDAVAADHLTSADKTTLDNSIKDAKKAGTDANTNIETYKVSNDARVKAVEDDVAEIVDGTNGILAQAKSYTDGKDSAMNTRVAALETAAPTHALKTEVEAVDAKFANYNTTVAQKAIDDAQDAEIAKKVNKTDYEADKATFATKTELGDVDAKFANYKTAADQKLVDDAQDVEIGKKVDQVVGKSLVDDAEITKLAGVSEGANKVEVSTNGKIKIDGVDTTVYVHPDKHTVSEISDFETKIASYDYATKTEAQGYADAKDEAIEAAQKTADDLVAYVGTFTASEGVNTVVKYIDAKTANIASDERVSGIDERLTQAEKDIDALETESAKHAIKTEVDGALALKADKSVVDAMYTNDQIDGFIAEAKKYADDNDADTKYGIVYDSDNKKIKLVEGGTDVEIDASAFIKDGMISNVTIGDDNDLVITFNTDAGKENIVLPLDQLVDIYTGVEGDRIKVTVNADKSISADLVVGSIAKDYLDAGVKASLALADSAIQAHQDISHLATTEALNGVNARFDNYTNTTDMNAKFDLKADKTQVATDIATAKSGAEVKAAELDAALKTELQAEIDADVKALADNTYTKAQTYTQTEVDALIQQATQWGEF